MKFFKRTIIVLSSLALIVLGSVFLFSTGNASADIVGGVPELGNVSSAIYVPPVEEEEEEVEEEPEEMDWEESSYQEDYSYDYNDSYAVSYEEDDYSSPSYEDGSVNGNTDGGWVSSSDFRRDGVHYDGSGYSYTWYSQNVLPGGGLNIPGRSVDDEGYVIDADGNVCIASDDLPYGTEVDIPFGSGKGKVYDCGSGYGNLDIYTSW